MIRIYDNKNFCIRQFILKIVNEYIEENEYIEGEENY